MTCPNCKYKYGWDGEEIRNIDGREGSFFESPIKLERNSNYTSKYQQRILYACPSCGIAFIDV